MRRTIATLALLALPALALVPAAPGQDRARGAEALWDKYPLAPSASPTVAPLPEPEPAREPPAASPPDEGDGLPVALLLGVAAAAAAAGAGAFRLAQRRSRTSGIALPVVRLAPSAAAAEARERPLFTRAPADPAPDAPPSTCRIQLYDRTPQMHFAAVDREGLGVIARSPRFTARRSPGDGGPDARQALAALVDQLAASGWVQTHRGTSPWDLRFERASARAEQPTDLVNG